MKRILSELKPFRRQILLLFLCVLGHTASNLALPYYLSQVINDAIPQEDFSSVLWAGLFMFLFLLFGVLCQIFQGYFAALTTAGMSKNLRSSLFSKVQSFSQAEMDAFSTSSLITRTNNDVTQLQQFTWVFLRLSLLAPFMFFGGILMTVNKNRNLAMLLLASLPFVAIFTFIVGKKSVVLSTLMQDKLDYLNQILREKLKGIRVTRAFNQEMQEEMRFQNGNTDYKNLSIRMNSLIAITMPIFNAVLYLTVVSILAFSGFRALQNLPIPIGDVVAITQYVTQILMSVVMLSVLFVMYPRASVSAARISQVLSATVSIKDDAGSKPFPSSLPLTLSFDNVSFRFPHAQSMALENISFEAKSGQVTAIIGSTGCGKSTLVDLIPRFYDCTEGNIYLNRLNLKEISLSSLREQIGYVPQTAFLFQGSVKENIDFASKNLSDTQIKEVLTIAKAYDFVSEKADGLETSVSQAGLNFSGGQKQRLTIARAIAKNPSIYIFDDSFSALDYKTDSALRKSLLSITKDAIVLIVAQRVSTIKNADRILVLEAGKIVGNGTHTELLDTCDIYRQIVSSQLNNEEV